MNVISGLASLLSAISPRRRREREDENCMALANATLGLARKSWMTETEAAHPLVPAVRSTFEKTRSINEPAS